MTDHTKPTNETRQADGAAAGLPHEPDRMPTSEESEAAEGLKTDPEVAKNYEDMAERGKNQKGEGRIP